MTNAIPRDYFDIDLLIAEQEAYAIGVTDATEEGAIHQPNSIPADLRDAYNAGYDDSLEQLS